jgi:DNA polymerase I-like protein with 3'-5' exonuclease and polymerase domains
VILIEFDLAGAEWVVVAYLAGDKNMIEVVESGKSPHVVTGALISGASEEFVLQEHKLVGSNTDPDTIMSLRRSLDIPHGIFLPRSMSIRQAGKKSNHGCNYYMRYKRFALENEMPETDAEPIVKFYSEKAYPGLQVYWEGIKAELKNSGRVLHNCFGRKVRIMGEWGVELWMAAYSFKPQSTVFDVCKKGMIRAYEDATQPFYGMELGAQVHDSIMTMYPKPTTEDSWYELATFMMNMVYRHMRTELRDVGAVDKVERSFVLGVDAKIGLNWGDMRSVKVTQDLDELVFSLKATLSGQKEVAAVVEPEWQAMTLLSPELPSA